LRRWRYPRDNSTLGSEDVNVQTVLQHGANGYVVKPFQIGAVIQRLNNLGL